MYNVVFLLQERGFWKLNFRIGGRKPPGHNPLVQNTPPILKFGFQVGDVWFCGFYPALPLNGGFMSGGLCPVTVSFAGSRQSSIRLHPQTFTLLNVSLQCLYCVSSARALRSRRVTCAGHYDYQTTQTIDSDRAFPLYLQHMHGTTFRLLYRHISRHWCDVVPPQPEE